LAGVPKRTVQEWRKTGFFVPALPEEATGHPSGELYALADVLTLRIMRLLLNSGAEREAVARFGEVFLIDPESESPFFARDWAVAEPLWCMVPATVELWKLESPDGYEADDDGCPLRFFTMEMLEQSLARDREGISRDDDGVYWRDDDGALLVVWSPFTSLVIELASNADHWRRQRRIALKHWPAWM
jgi:hypothetical protein